MFSVVIPAYNAEKFIKTSIASVLNQTYKDFELIIVDDGSIDRTRNVIEQFNDDRIIYIYQENGGVSSARNRGIFASKNNYICFLDSDDEWKPNHLEIVSSLIKKYNECGMYISGYDIRLSNGEIVPKSNQLLSEIHQDDFASHDGYAILNKYGYFFNTNTICCRRDVFERVGVFEVGVKNGEDDDMWFRILAYYSLAISKQSTTIYNRLNSSATGRRVYDSDRQLLERVGNILDAPDVVQDRKDSLMIWLEKNKLSQARKYILMGEKKEARRLLGEINCKVVNPKKYLVTFVCLLFPSQLIKGYVRRRDAAYFNVKDE